MFSSQDAEESGNLSNTFVTEFIVSHYDGYKDMSAEEQRDFVDTLDIIVRKGAHICEYMILCFLNYLWLFAYGVYQRIGRNKYLLLSVAMTVFYSITDEIHQTFVPGRSGNVTDVLIDSIGSVIATLIVLIIIKKSRFLKK